MTTKTAYITKARLVRQVLKPARPVNPSLPSNQQVFNRCLTGVQQVFTTKNQEPITKNQEPLTNGAAAGPPLQKTPSPNSEQPFDEIVTLWREILPECRPVDKLTLARMMLIRDLWCEEELPALENWKNFFLYIKKSKWLTGQVASRDGGPRFKASLEWVTTQKNYIDINEEKYHGKT